MGVSRLSDFARVSMSVHTQPASSRRPAHLHVGRNPRPHCWFYSIVNHNSLLAARHQMLDYPVFLDTSIGTFNALLSSLFLYSLLVEFTPAGCVTGGWRARNRESCPAGVSCHAWTRHCHINEFHMQTRLPSERIQYARRWVSLVDQRLQIVPCLSLR